MRGGALTAKTKTKKTFPATRKFALRTDATVGSGASTIEKTFKLPKGSVRLVLPNKRPASADKRIGALLDDWAKKNGGY
jgi:hypothetical protein